MGDRGGAGERDGRARVTRLIVAQIFLIFFQTFMVAPLVPRLAELFAVPRGDAALLVPAYAIPYGCVCLLVGPVADRYGRGRVLRLILTLGAGLPALSTLSSSLPQLIAWRIATALVLGGVAPIALAMIASMYPYRERGRPIGWVFGAIAGGMALGASLGPILEPTLGWRGVFLAVSAVAALLAVPSWRALAAVPVLPPAAATDDPTAAAAASPPAPPTATTSLVRVYARLLRSRRGATLYGFVFANGVFHSGVFSWLGVYFADRYHLEGRAVGLAMLGYGIPGFLLGPVVGRLADRFGRRGLIRIGLTLAALCALVLAAPLPVIGATVAITALSFGFDLSHPLFSGLVSTLDPVHTAQAMAVNAFAIFVGMGIGSLLFGAALGAFGMATALVIFGAGQLVLAATSVRQLDASYR